MRRVLFAAIAAPLLLLIGTAASAGDFANLDIIGFSPDGDTFAFEQYGEHDGSGAPYSDIFVIDVDRDAWVAGTPIHVDPRNEDSRLDAVRSQAATRAAPLLAKLGVSKEGLAVVSNPASELGNDPYHVRFLTGLMPDFGSNAWSLALTLLRFPEPSGCENLGPTNGFRLVLTEPNGAAHILNEDRALPASRGCAQDYAISHVVTYRPTEGESAMVVLLSVVLPGFEGPDRRYLAVATRFAER